MDTTRATRDAATCRAVIAGATEAVGELLAPLWQVQGAELGALLAQLDELASRAGGARVAVAAEAQTRGEITASQAGSTATWIAAHAPSASAGTGAAGVARLLREGTRRDCLPVLAAVTSGRIGVSVGLAVFGEFGRLRPRWRDGAAPTVLEGLLELGRADGARGV
jgi:hypothetical protein